MNLGQLGYIFGSGWLGLKLLSILIELIGRVAYDIKQVNASRKEASNRTGRIKKLPVIINIRGRGSESDLNKCLKSLASHNYSGLIVHLLNDELSPADKRVIKLIRKSYPKLHVKITSFSARSKLVFKKKSKKAMVEIKISRREQLSGNFLPIINMYFIKHKGVTRILPAIKIVPDKSLIGLVQEYDALADGNKKILGLRLPDPITNEYVSIITATQKKMHGAYLDQTSLLRLPEYSYRNVWANSVKKYVAQIESLPHRSIIKGFAGTVIGFGALLEPYAIAYFVFLATALGRPEPLALGWGMGVFSLIFYSYSAKHLSVAQKLRLVLLAPVGYLEMLILALSRSNAMVVYVLMWLKKDWMGWKQLQLQT